REGETLPGAAVTAQSDGVDAVGGDGAGRGGGEVRRREAHLTAPGVAVDDDTAHPVGPAQHGDGAGDVPGLDELARPAGGPAAVVDRKSTRLNSSHVKISYAVFCLKKKKTSC